MPVLVKLIPFLGKYLLSLTAARRNCEAGVLAVGVHEVMSGAAVVLRGEIPGYWSFLPTAAHTLAYLNTELL